MQIGAEWCQANGITNITMLLSFQATRGGVVHAVQKATKNFGPEDLLVLTLAGHGTRVRDYSGDEVDGWDSAWCLSDGIWIDDYVGYLIESLPPCRILFIADTCHSEESWKSVTPLKPVDLDIYNCNTLKWEKLVDDTLCAADPTTTLKPLDVSSRGKFTWKGSLLQLAASRRDQSSLGGANGGQWFAALDDSMKFGKPKTTLQWFNDAKSGVENQNPVMSKYGPLAITMLNGAPLQ
jgi:hypothetical protein